jgi:orotate phosphoribosyltransferase
MSPPPPFLAVLFTYFITEHVVSSGSTSDLYLDCATLNTP